MAEQRTARVEKIDDFGNETRLLHLSLAEGHSLDFIGGQYLIIDSGLPLPGGKIAKRAYSILSGDADQRRFQIAVRKIGAGIGSNFLHRSVVEEEIRFSGPWGKFIPRQETETDKSTRKTWILATDTGITAALGLVQSRIFMKQSSALQLLWWVPSEYYFLPKTWVAKSFDFAVSFETQEIAPVEAAQRAVPVLQFLETKLESEMPNAVYLVGDGNVLFPIKETLLNKGIPETSIQIECFFNNPFRKATS